MMARLSNKRSAIAAERLRLIISRSPGGYQRNLTKWARILGVQERSVERYLQRSGTNRRFIRDPAMKRKIDRAFTRRVRERPDFIPFDIVLGRGEYFNVTAYLVGTMGDGENPVLPIFTEVFNSSVWLENVRLPRILFQADDSTAPNQGMANGRVLVDLLTLDGAFYAEGDERNFVTNDYPSNTFGDVANPAIGTKGNPNDLSIGISRSVGDILRSAGSSKPYSRITFTPEAAIEIYPNLPEAERIGTIIRNRNPILRRNEEGRAVIYEWNEVNL